MEETIAFCSNILRLKDNPKYLSCEDYKDLLTLNLIFLREIPPNGVHFHDPGACHHARWMSKLLLKLNEGNYITKIYLFRPQFKLGRPKQEGQSIIRN